MKANFIQLIAGIWGAFLCSPMFLSAQDEIGAHPSMYVRHFERQAAMSWEIGTTAPSGPIKWAFCYSTTPGGCVPLDKAIGYTETLPGGVKVEISPPSAPRKAVVTSTATSQDPAYYLKFRVYNDLGTYDQSREYQLVFRDPFEMVFVLDWSGSMECDEGSNTNAVWPCTSHVNPRWDKLESAIGEFLNEIDQRKDTALLTNDEFSVVYFSGDVLTDPPKDLDGLDSRVDFIVIDAATDGLVDNMNKVSLPQLGRDGTSIGKGVLEAITARYGTLPNRRRVMLLFTDGEQNRSPYMRVSGSTVYIDKNDNNLMESGEQVNSTIPNLEVFPIAVGQFTGAPSISHLFDLLAGAVDNYYVGPSNNILKGMSDAFNDIYGAYSPEFIRVEEQTPDTLNQASFLCNDNVSRLIFKAQYESKLGNAYTYHLEHDGVEVEPDVWELEIGPYYANLIIDFRVAVDITSKGEWVFSCRRRGENIIVDEPSEEALIVRDSLEEVVVVGQPPAEKVVLSAIADDHTVDIELGGLDGLKVGDRMNPTLQLSLNGRPVQDAEVKAVILKPGDDLGDLLARANVSVSDDPNSEFGLCTTQKFSALLESNAPALQEYFNFQENTLELRHQGGGRFAADNSYNGLDISGVYEVLFFINAAGLDVGQIQRFKSKYVNVRFGDVDLTLMGKTTKLQEGDLLSAHGITFGQPNDEGQTIASLRLTPSYRSNGRILRTGPGMGVGLNIAGQGIDQVEITDNCNGQYIMEFPAEKNTRISLSLFEEEVYQGRAGDYDKPYYKYPGGISLHGGITYPLEDLDTLYDGSFFLEADIGYQIHPYLSLEGVLGYYGFSNGFDILGASIYAKGQFNLSQANLFATVAAGGGYYFPKQEASSAGFNLRVSALRRLNMRWDISLEASYFRMVDAGQYSWGTLGAGAKYRF